MSVLTAREAAREEFRAALARMERAQAVLSAHPHNPTAVEMFSEACRLTRVAFNRWTDATHAEARGAHANP